MGGYSGADLYRLSLEPYEGIFALREIASGSSALCGPGVVLSFVAEATADSVRRVAEILVPMEASWQVWLLGGAGLDATLLVEGPPRPGKGNAGRGEAS